MERKFVLIGLLMLICMLNLFSIAEQQLFQLKGNTESFAEIEFNLTDYEFILNEIDGTTYHRIYHDEAGLLLEEGLPELPVFSVTIAIPNTGTVYLDEVEVLDTEYLNNVRVFPSQGPDLLISPERGFIKDSAFYNRNVVYPSSNSEISTPAVVRDFRFVSVAVTPFRYNPAASELTIDKKIRLKVNYDPYTPGENEIIPTNHKISRSFENIYRSMFLNYDEIRNNSWEYQARSILIVHHYNALVLPIVEQFADWKRDKGFEVATVSTLNLASNTAIKNYIQNAYDNWEHPPEYILLVGGGTGSLTIPTFSAYSAQGDHPYGLLEGNDDIPDAFVGRFPIADATQLQTIWNKIRNYEREPFVGNTDWYEHSLLVGDTTTSSGISPKITMKYIRELMLYQNEDYQFTEHYTGSMSTVANGAINQGVSFFPFRGYIGMAGWSPTDGALNNGLMLPNCFFITCSTLYFDNSSRTEKMVNMGTPVTPKGGIAAIGMNTASTKTTFNNALTAGFFFGIFNEGLRTMGETLARGKIFLHQNWDVVHPSLPPVHTQKASLMGDPSMDIWVETPKELNVSYEDELPLGRNYIDFLVTDADELPVEDAWVTIRQVVGDDELLFVTGYTDNNGEITHIFDPDNSGIVKVTVTKPDYIPHLGNFELTGEASVTLNDVVMLDDFDAGTEVSFILTVKNYLDITATGVEGTITANTPYVEILEGTSSFGDIAPDAVAESVDQFVVTISQSAPDYLPVTFTLTISDSENNWTSKFTETVNGSNLTPTNLLVGTNNNHYISPGETASLRITVENSGQTDLEEVYGVLRTNNPLLDISDSLAYFGNIDAGQSVTSASDNSFIVTAFDDLIKGMNVNIELYLYNDLGFEVSRNTILPVGLVTSTDPYGPCDYGYYIYGMEDEGYEHTPQYDWIEIAPQLGGQGNNTGLTGDWQNNQSVMNMPLPFTFRFYGIDYDVVSICSNGWISFGVSEIASFRNTYIPGPMGPSPIVAAFWDNLSLSGGGVYTYYDEEEEIFIIQWHNATIPGSHQNTFQIILYNPELEPTIDDGFIKIQYKVFNNLNNSTSYADWSNYCTIGIGDHSSDIGLTYTFANQYPTAASTLSNESAIMIVGPKNYSEPFLIRQNVVVYDEDNSGYIDAGENVKLGIYLKNIGYATATNVTGTISTSSNFISIVNNTSDYYDIDTGSEVVNQDYFEVDVSASTPNGHIAHFILEIDSAEATVQFPFHLNVNKPSLGLASYLIQELDGNDNGQIDPGETINLVLDFVNPTMSIVKNITLNISSTHENLSINTPYLDMGDIDIDSTLQQPVSITIDESCPAGEIIPISLAIDADNITTINKVINIGVSLQDIFLDLENDDGNLISNDPDGWQWGEPNIPAYSGDNVWGTVLDGNYADGISWSLESPDFLITPNSNLSFYHYYVIENYWDGGNVKISTDEGNTWQIIHPDAGYPVANTNSGNSGIPNQPAFSGNSNGWQNETFELSSLFGQVARFSWHFGSGPWVNEVGWYIDDIALNLSAPLYSFVTGSVELLQSPFSLDDITITNGQYSVKPDINGNFTLVIPAGTHTISAIMPYHYSNVEHEVVIGELETINGIDFILQYLTPATNLTFELYEEDTLIELDWEYEPLPELLRSGSRTSGRDRDYLFAIYRQQDSGYFELLDSTTDLSYTDTLPIPESIYRYYIVVEYPEGESASSNIVATDDPDDDIEEVVQPENNFVLRQNYPNPFNPVTNISFNLPEQEDVSLKIYNIKGELVKTLIDEILPAGTHTVQWSGVNNYEKQVSSGIYFYRLEAGRYREAKKALLLK